MEMKEAVAIIEALQAEHHHPGFVETMEWAADNLKALTNHQLAAYMIVTDALRKMFAPTPKLDA